jgi:Leucine-rich repeat (LRR) protein
MRNEIQGKINSSTGEQVDLGRMKITDNELSDIALKIIECRPKVKDVFLNHNLITDEGAFILRDYLSKLSQLETIYLESNKIGLKGCAAIDSLKKQKPELTIALHGNKVTSGQMFEVEQKNETPTSSYKMKF